MATKKARAAVLRLPERFRETISNVADGMGIVYVARLKQYDVAAVGISAIREVRFVAKRLVRWFKPDRLAMMSDRKRHSSRKSKNKEITSRPNCRS